MSGKLKRRYIIVIWAIILCFIFCSCDSTKYEQDISLDAGDTETENNASSEFDDIALQLEEDCMGYDIAWIRRAGPTLRVYVVVDFDRNIQTEMDVHNHKGGGYTHTDHVQTINISGDMEQGWQTNYFDDALKDIHLFYERSMQDDKEIIIEYDYQHKLTDTYFIIDIESAVEKLSDGLDGLELKEISEVLRPEES